MTTTRRLLALACVLPFAPGCGPVMSTYLILSAQADLDGAQAAEAEKYAIYEYTAATEYLHKAREEQGYADFGPSIDFAYKAGEYAVKGRERAEKEKRNLEAPGEIPLGMPVEEPAPAQKRVIIKKSGSASVAPDAEQESVKVRVVPVQPETGPK
jgi:hypothetical protein